MKHILPLICIWFVHPACCQEISPNAKAFIDSIFASELKKHRVTGAAIAIVNRNGVVYTTGYGFADKTKKVPASSRTIFRIGSCTKSFTAISLLQLQEQGLLDISQSAKEYLPEFGLTNHFNESNPFYINEMLCHTSGMPGDIANGFLCDNPPDIKWVIRQLNKQTAASPRLYKHSYSNVAYALCGEIIARVSKSSYSDYVRQHIFSALKMNSSYVETDAQASADFSKGYYNGKEMREPPIRDYAAGSIHSSALDMANYLCMYLNTGTFNNERILSETSIREMEKNHTHSLKLNDAGNWGYGLYAQQLLIKDKAANDSSIARLIGHAGATPAFRTDFKFIPELGIGAIILTNSDGGQKIADAGKLLGIYLEKTSGKKITFNYQPLPEQASHKNIEQPCRPEEITGKYIMQGMLIDMKKQSKIKFRNGRVRFVMKKVNAQPGHYRLHARIFNLIPVKIKTRDMKFVKLDDHIYLKGIHGKSQPETYLAKKLKISAIPASWSSAYGHYKITGDSYTCTGCPYMDSKNLQLSISESNGLIMINIKGNTPDMTTTLYLEVVSERLCITSGIGRSTGETVRLLENGNIYYSGFEFKKRD